MKARLFTGLTVLIAAFLVAGLIPGQARAQDDRCLRTIGEFDVRLTGYQVAYGDTRLCEDIPDIGPTALTLDFGDVELRQMKTSVRLVEVDSWSAAQEGSDDDRAKVLVQLPPQTYPKGLVVVEHTFKAPGYFAEVVSIEDQSGSKHELRFPIRVAIGLTDAIGVGTWSVIGALLVITLIAYWFYRKRRSDDITV
jgi:hypothetical protein